jgi:hypothetical protein
VHVRLARVVVWRRSKKPPRSFYQRAQRSAAITIAFSSLYVVYCVVWSIYDVNHGFWPIAIVLCVIALFTIVYTLRKSIQLYLNMRARGY